MKTTLEIPDELFKRVKMRAVSRGYTLKRYISEALESKLRDEAEENTPKPWMKSFGRLSHLKDETQLIEKRVEAEFETIDQAGWK